MGRGSRSAVAVWAQQAVLDHVARTTAGLPGRIALDRFEQVASDVWEQAAAADRAGDPGLRLAAALLWRALRGLPADARWRADALREAGAERTTRAHAGHLPLPSAPPFDQTNGLIVFDAPPPAADDGDDLRRLLAQALASNAVNVGMVGGNL